VVCIVAIAGSISLKSYLHRHFHPEKSLPILAHITNDLEAVERSGTIVNTSTLRGKVCVIAYIYTVCPHGCAAVIGEMLKLKSEFRSRNDFHLVSITVVPERDDIAFLRSYADGIGLKPDDPWWFLTGVREKLSRFITDEIKLEPSVPIPESKRLNPLDLYEHDLRIALVDRGGNVRGYYAVFHPQTEIAELFRKKLHKDTRRLLDDPAL